MLHKSLHRIVETGTTAAAGISGIAIILSMLIMLAEAISRYVFSTSIAGASAFTVEYLLMVAIYFALAYTWTSNQHARVTLIRFERWPSMSAIIRAVELLVTALVLAMIIFANIQSMQNARVGGSVSSGVVPFALWPAYLLICIGTAVFLVSVLFYVGKPPLARASADSKNVPVTAQGGA